MIFGQKSCKLGPRQLVRQEVNIYYLVWASKVNPDGLVQVHFSIAVSEEQLIDKGWPMLEILSMSELSLLEVGTFP